MKTLGTGAGWRLLLIALGIPLLVYAASSGPAAGLTGSPFPPDNGHSCADCHVGSGVNTGPGSVTITVRDGGGVNVVSGYATGQSYQITVRVSDPNKSAWGFQMRASAGSGQQAGTLSPKDGTTKVVASAGIQYIEHSTATATVAGAGSNFVFHWQAPSVSTGPVVFHAAGNAADNGGDEYGDRIYTTSVTLPPQASPAPPPSISEGGIVNNASFALHPAPLAPGSIVAVFGSNLNDGSEVRFSSFGPDGKLVTSLGGASVTVNGIAAPMFYSFPGQLGIQIPAQLQEQTSASVQVTVAGQASAPRTIFLDAAVPGIFTFSQDGKGAGAITHAAGSAVSAQAPARREEVVILYATGLGALNPPLPTGAPSTGNRTATPATVTVDGVPVEVQFSGTAPGFVGLNQINFRVPANARLGNDIPVMVSLGARQSNTATLAIAP